MVIIKPGKSWKKTCSFCGCVFSYNRKDYKVSYVPMSKYFIDCPWCDMEIPLDDDEHDNDLF